MVSRLAPAELAPFTSDEHGSVYKRACSSTIAMNLPNGRLCQVKGRLPEASKRVGPFRWNHYRLVERVVEELLIEFRLVDSVNNRDQTVMSVVHSLDYSQNRATLNKRLNALDLSNS